MSTGDEHGHDGLRVARQGSNDATKWMGSHIALPPEGERSETITSEREEYANDGVPSWPVGIDLPDRPTTKNPGNLPTGCESC